MGIFNLIRKFIASIIAIGLTVYICIGAILPSLEKTGLNGGSIAAILIFTAIGLLFLVIGPIVFWVSRNFFSIIREYANN